MLGYIDWIIILVALLAAVGAVLLLLPQTNSKETQELRVVRLQAEADRKRVAEVLEVTQHGASDAENILIKLKAQVEQTTRSYEASQARAEQAERIMERVTTLNKKYAAFPANLVIACNTCKATGMNNSVIPSKASNASAASCTKV